MDKKINKNEENDGSQFNDPEFEKLMEPEYQEPLFKKPAFEMKREKHFNLRMDEFESNDTYKSENSAFPKIKLKNLHISFTYNSASDSNIEKYLDIVKSYFEGRLNF